MLSSTSTIFMHFMAEMLILTDQQDAKHSTIMLSSTSTIFMHFMAEMLILTDIFHFDSNNGCFKKL